MINSLPLLLGAVLVACSQDLSPENNGANGAAAAKPTSQCEPPTLGSEDKALAEGSALFRETKANFSAAFASACAKGLLKESPLIDPTADRGRLFLLNAPDANVASIYLPNGTKRMVLEFPFLTHDGRTNVPSANDLEEAIYCSVHGATAEEQESSGRCLVD